MSEYRYASYKKNEISLQRKSASNKTRGEVPAMMVLGPEKRNLYDAAFLASLASFKKGGASSVFEDFSDTIVHLGGTFKIPLCTNLTCDCLALLSEMQRKEILLLEKRVVVEFYVVLRLSWGHIANLSYIQPR